MAWGKSKPAPPPSTFSQLLPLFIVLFIVGLLAWIGYQIYVTSGQIHEQAKSKMGKKNVVFTKDGVRVGVKEMESEKYVDATQSWVVKAWNLKDGKAQAAGSPRDATQKKK